MALSEADEESILQALTEDLRRLYDHVDSNWINLKNRVLTVAFGEVAIASFIFSTDFKLNKFTTAEIMFFFTGVLLMLASFTVLLWIFSTSHWIIPLDTTESRKVFIRHSSKVSYLKHVKNDYEETIDFCVSKVDTRSRAFNKVLVALTFGILILLVVKFTR
jgi:hypothetical protein